MWEQDMVIQLISYTLVFLFCEITKEKKKKFNWETGGKRCLSVDVCKYHLVATMSITTTKKPVFKVERLRNLERLS